MKRNKLILGVMVLATMVSSITAFGAVDKDTSLSMNEIIAGDISECSDVIIKECEFTFKDFKEDLKEDLTKEELEEAEALFKDAIEYEKKATETWDELYQMDIFDYDEFEYSTEPWTFEDFKIDFKDGLSNDDVEKAEKLFDKAMNLEEKEKYEDAVKVWDELCQMDIFDYDEFEYSTEPWTFEDFKIDFKDGLSNDDVEKAEKLFDKAMNLEEKEKYEDANKVWDELDGMDLFEIDEFSDWEVISIDDNEIYYFEIEENN